MDEDRLEQLKDEDAIVFPYGLGPYGHHIVVGGVRISHDDYPDCLSAYRDSDCYRCEFLIPDRCPLRNDPDQIKEIRHLFAMYRRWRAAELKRQDERIRALESELKDHGIPLHSSVLAHMVRNRYPGLEMTENMASQLMASRPDTFEKVAPGIYGFR